MAEQAASLPVESMQEAKIEALEGDGTEELHGPEGEGVEGNASSGTKKEESRRSDRMYLLFDDAPFPNGPHSLCIDCGAFCTALLVPSRLLGLE